MISSLLRVIDVDFEFHFLVERRSIDQQVGCLEFAVELAADTVRQASRDTQQIRVRPTADSAIQFRSLIETEFENALVQSSLRSEKTVEQRRDRRTAGGRSQFADHVKLALLKERLQIQSPMKLIDNFMSQ